MKNKYGQSILDALGDSQPMTIPEQWRDAVKRLCYYCYHRLYLQLFLYCIFKLLFSYLSTQPQVWNKTQCLCQLITDYCIMLNANIIGCLQQPVKYSNVRKGKVKLKNLIRCVNSSKVHDDNKVSYFQAISATLSCILCLRVGTMSEGWAWWMQTESSYRAIAYFGAWGCHAKQRTILLDLHTISKSPQMLYQMYQLRSMAFGIHTSSHILLLHYKITFCLFSLQLFSLIVQNVNRKGSHIN